MAKSSSCSCQVFNGTLAKQQEQQQQQEVGESATDEPPISTGKRNKLKSKTYRHYNDVNKRQNKKQLSVSLIKLLVLLIAQIPAYHGLPIASSVLGIASRAGHSNGNTSTFNASSDSPGTSSGTTAPEGDADLWFNLTVSAILVLLGGAFAGLTLGLMGQDEVYLQVMLESGEASERKSAAKVLNLLKKGKHWVLVTLLLSNVITNETLPIVLDRCLGGGWPAVVSSTVAIVIFGEIIPQSVSVRYGLSVGAIFAPFVLGLMYLMYPVAFPIALLLDHILGEDHGTMYKRSGLKTLVTLHKSMGVERLNEDEVTIISAVLDLKDKSVSKIMTPMEDVFVLSSDTILDEENMEKILHTGFNRIPIHTPGEPTNFIGMLLVRILITYDPEDALPVSSFPLATLPETGPDTSCLNILNYFQEGKSHMVIVSETPGEPWGAMGVLTLEDVIEELIGEEIIDESDVYVDVHKAIRRTQPGPFAKRSFLQSPITSHMLGHNNHSHSHSFEQHLRSIHNIQHGGVTGDSNTTPTVFPKLEPSNNAMNPRQVTTKNITIKNLQQRQQSGSYNNSARVSTDEGSAVGNNARPASQDVFPDLVDSVIEEDLSSYKTQPKIIVNLNGKDTNGSKLPPLDDQILGQTPGDGNVFRTEAGALKDALPNISSDKENDKSSNNRGRSSSINNNNNNNQNLLGGDMSYRQRSSSPSNLMEVHSYRTGGIIESVVNVQGVNKIIIEDAFSDDIRRTRSNSSSHVSSNGSGHGGRDDTSDTMARRPLLSGTDS